MVKWVIFDFDGTIADSYDVTNKIIKNLGIDHISLSKLKNHGLKSIFKKIDIPLWKIPSVIRKYHKAIETETIEKIKPFKGILPVIKELSKNHALGIVSGNSEKNIKIFLKRNSMDKYFKVIHSDESLFRKGKVIKKICRKRKIDKKDLIYVGDELRDIEACKKLGIKIIAVDWGYQSEKFLEKHSPDFSAKTPKDILKGIRKLHF